MADGTLKVGTITTSSGSGTITIGQSGETINIPSGATVSGAGTNTPAFSVTPSGNTTLAANTYTLVQFNTVEFDTNSKYDTGSYYYEIPETGKYLVQVQTRVQNQTGAQTYVGPVLYKDSSSSFGSETQVSFPRNLTEGNNPTYDPETVYHITDMISFTAGEFVRVKVYNQASDTTLCIGGTGEPRCSAWSMMKLIGA